MRLTAIDPGSKQSGWVSLVCGQLLEFGIEENESLLAWFLRQPHPAEMLAIGYMRACGMPTHDKEFDTQFVVGRLVQAWSGPWTPIYNRDVKMTLCGTMRAKDKNIRAAVIDRYPATGGGKEPQIGTRAKPGPLYGVATHVWSALAIGLTYLEHRRDKCQSPMRNDG